MKRLIYKFLAIIISGVLFYNCSNNNNSVLSTEKYNLVTSESNTQANLNLQPDLIDIPIGDILPIPLPIGIINRDLIAYWKFDERRGRTAYNELPTGDARLFLVRRRRGVKGRALYFNGRGYAIVKENRFLDFSNEFSITLWIKNNLTFPEIGKFTNIIYRKGGNLHIAYSRDKIDSLVWLFAFVKYAKKDSSGNFLFHELDVLDDPTRPTAEAYTRDGNWHHIAVVFKRGVEFSIYIDGELIESKQALNYPAKLSPNDNSYIFGAFQRMNGTIDRYYKGYIDELKFWKKALTEKEIKDDMAN